MKIIESYQLLKNNLSSNKIILHPNPKKRQYSINDTLEYALLSKKVDE